MLKTISVFLLTALGDKPRTILKYAVQREMLLLNIKRAMRKAEVLLNPDPLFKESSVRAEQTEHFQYVGLGLRHSL